MTNEDRDNDSVSAAETAPSQPQQSQQQSQQQQQKFGTSGTILEAAFVDPSYQWPPPDGVGKNAIELQASVNLIQDDNESVKTTDSQRERMTIPDNPAASSKKKNSSSSSSNDTSDGRTSEHKYRWWNCCRGGSGGDTSIIDLAEYEKKKKSALKYRKKHYSAKKARAKKARMKERYNRVPEGILIYRLDTATQTISLMSDINTKTDTESLVHTITVTSAKSSSDKTRRGMVLTGFVNVDDSDDDEEGGRMDTKKNQTEITLVACEQRTSIAWLEAIDLMLANKQRMGDTVRYYVLRLRFLDIILSQIIFRYCICVLLFYN